MEILINSLNKRLKPKAALFDFDGTISTLRHGWENIMEPMMLEMIAGGSEIDKGLAETVRNYIDQSTGIQTIYQMRWLSETIRKYGRNKGASDDPWWYKAEYNRRLMRPVEKRIQSIVKGEKAPRDFLMKGSEEFIRELRDRGIEIFVASGTDHPDVNREAEVLGLASYFREIAGAPVGKADCSKEAVLRRLVEDYMLKGPEVVVIGDGKVEIALGREAGAFTLGVASDEEKLCGVNPVKRTRLINAGAHAIVGDFSELDTLLNWLGI